LLSRALPRLHLSGLSLVSFTPTRTSQARPERGYAGVSYIASTPVEVSTLVIELLDLCRVCMHLGRRLLRHVGWAAWLLTFWTADLADGVVRR
jgi:hypothetical protein